MVCYFYTQIRAMIAERLHIRGYTNERGSNIHIDMPYDVFVFLFVRDECRVTVKTGNN